MGAPRGREALQVGVLLSGVDGLPLRGQLVPGGGGLQVVFVEQVLAVIQELRIGEEGQGDDLPVEHVRLAVGREELGHHLVLVRAEILVERFGPAGGLVLRGADDVDEEQVERAVLRGQHGVQVLGLLLGGRAADLDLGLDAGILGLEAVEQLAHEVRPGVAAHEDAKRGLGDGVAGGQQAERGSESCAEQGPRSEWSRHSIPSRTVRGSRGETSRPCPNLRFLAGAPAD